MKSKTVRETLQPQEHVIPAQAGIQYKSHPVTNLSLDRPAKRLPHWKTVRAFRKSLPAVETSTVDLVREMRDASY